jgi:ABC-type Zn2+ transport system substrate-binding protein/surface adhesin
MSHHEHEHTHEHKHEHTHGHEHTHDHDHVHEMSFEEKISTLLNHWIDHNNSHMETYRSWAQKAEDASLADVAVLLKETAEASGTITRKLETALKAITQ